MAANLMHVRNNREAFAGMNDMLDIQQAVNFQQIQPSRGEQTNPPAKRLRQLQAPPPEMPTDPSSIRLLEICNKIPGTGQDRMGWQLSADQNFVFRLRPPTDPSSIRLLEICNKIPGTGQDRMGWQLSADQNFVFRLRPLLESYDELTNKALLRDHFEVEWSQDSNFYTIPELRGLEVRDEEGKLIPTWSASFDWASLYAMFASLRNVIVSSPGRMKSASEIPRKIPDSLELLVPDSMLKITSDYLLRLLRVPVSQLNMTALKLVSQAVAAADQTLSSISSSCKCLCLRFGHFADKLVRSEAIKTGVTKLYVAHNTTVAGAASILMEGTVRPSYWDPQDNTWVPPMSFYARAHPHDAEQAQETASKYGGILRSPQVALKVTAHAVFFAMWPEPKTADGSSARHASFLKLFLLFGRFEEFCKTLTFHVSRSQVLPSILLTGLSL
eukprot:s1773_g7.t1